MSDAAQGAIELAVFFAMVVSTGWVMRGRLTDVTERVDADGSAAGDDLAPVVSRAA